MMFNVCRIVQILILSMSLFSIIEGKAPLKAVRLASNRESIRELTGRSLATNTTCDGVEYSCPDADLNQIFCCSGSAYCCSSEDTTDCSSGTPVCEAPKSDSGSCFGMDSEINYNGKTYSYRDLLDGHEEDCVIPHVVLSDGFNVTTNCGIFSVSSDHLILTDSEMVPANSLRLGDKLDSNNQHDCLISSITKTNGKFFGLNCKTSVIGIGGVKASTFGNNHYWPSKYFDLMTKVTDIKTASKIAMKLANTIDLVSIAEDL
jgi:hypothetical protein